MNIEKLIIGLSVNSRQSTVFSRKDAKSQRLFAFINYIWLKSDTSDTIYSKQLAVNSKQPVAVIK